MTICYAKVNKYILTLQNDVLIDIEDYTTNTNINELILFKKGNKYKFKITFTTREKAFYYKFFENYQLLFFENGYSGFYKDYDDKNRIICEFYHINGVKNGLEKKYDYNKLLRIEINYINDKPIEKKIFRLKSNKLIKYVKYLDDKFYTEIYYDNNNLNEKYTTIQYEDGKYDGYYLNYYDNGKLKKEEFYKEGKKDGIHKYYYENGILHLEMIYENNKLNGSYKEYNVYGRILLNATYKIGKLDGIKLEYYDTEFGTDKLLSESNYIDGCLNGEYKQYYKNGNMKVLCNYKYDKTSELSYSGKKYVNITKCEKNKHGEIIEFYENGNIHKRGNYIDNKLNGIYYIYSENGNIIKELKYKNNEFLS